jgi:hypothetical protein
VATLIFDLSSGPGQARGSYRFQANPHWLTNWSVIGRIGRPYDFARPLVKRLLLQPLHPKG